MFVVVFKPFGFIAPKDFQIDFLFNLLNLSVPDEGYSSALYCLSLSEYWLYGLNGLF
jgi:hypothetical protein